MENSICLNTAVSKQQSILNVIHNRAYIFIIMLLFNGSKRFCE